MFRHIFLVAALIFSCSAGANSTILGEHKFDRWEQEDFERLIEDMLKWIASHSHYARLKELPVVEFAAPDVIAEEECRGFCPVARFIHGRLMLSTALDIFHKPDEESVVLHELVHYYQFRSGRDVSREGIGCEEERALETEAYQLQQEYYRTHGGRYMIPLIPVLFCDKDGVLKVKQQDD